MPERTHATDTPRPAVSIGWRRRVPIAPRRPDRNRWPRGGPRARARQRKEHSERRPFSEQTQGAVAQPILLEQQDDGGGVGDHQKPRYSMKPIEPSLRAGREVCSSISAADEVLKLPSVVAGILNRLDLLANLPGAVDGAPLRANYHALRQVQMCRQRPRDCGRTVSLHTMRHRLVATRNRRYPRPPIRRHRCYM